MRGFAFFLRHPRFAFALALLTLIIGILMVPRVPVAAYPSVARPAINVTCTYPGANAREVMNTVAGPLEEQVNGVEGMDSMSSTCSDSGSYTLTVKFQVGYDRDLALMKVQSRVQQALSLLPQEVKNTGVTVESGSTEELGILTLRSKNGKLTREQLVDYAFGVVNPSILRVPGVGKSVVQDSKIAMRVWLDARRMAAFGINTEEVVTAVKQQNVQASLGSVGTSPTGEPERKIIALISKGRLDNEEEFANIVVRVAADGSLVRLGDIARIEKGQQSYPYSALYEEQPAVFIQIYQHPGVDVLGTINEIKSQLKGIESVLPSDLAWELSHDVSRYMLGALASYAWIIVAAAVLVLSLVVWWLGSVRSALPVILALPVPMAAVFAVLVVSGFSVNILTAGAFVLILPLVAALAAVMVSNIRRSGAEDAIGPLTPSLLAVGVAVALAMVPISFIDGVPGVICRQFGVVLGVGAVAATFNALVFVPVLAERLVTSVRVVAKTSRPFFGVAIGGGFFALLLVALGISAWGLINRLPREFIPDEDMGYVIIDCKTAEGRSRPLTAEVMKRIYRDIRQLGGVRSSISLLGSSIIFSSTENNAKMYLFLNDWGGRELHSSEFASRIRRAVADIPEAEVYVIRPPAVAGFGSMNGISVLVQSMEDNDPVRFAVEAQRILRVLSASSLAEYVSCGTKADSPHLRVHVDRDKCQLMNVPMSSLYTTLQHYLGSVYVNDINLGTQVNRVTLMSDWDGRSRPEGVNELFVRSTTGDMVPVSALVRLEEELGVSACYRYNKYLYCTLQFIPKSGVSESDALAEIRRLCAENLPRGYRQDWAGLTYEQFKSRGDTGLLVTLALLAVLLVIVVRFESFAVAFASLVPTVAAAFGVAVVHLVMGVSVSLYSLFALLALVVIFAAGSMLTWSDAPLRERGFLPMVLAVAALPLLFVSGPGAGGAYSLGLTIFGGAIGYAAFAVFVKDPHR